VIVCLVTDRRRLGQSVPVLLAQLREAVAAGVDLIHVRERDLNAADLSSLVTEVVALSRGSSTRVVVNDRLDVALACGADGVHLRSDSLPTAGARLLAPKPFLIGRSIHSAQDAVEAAGADYLIAGTVFPTASKPGAAELGIEGLRAVVLRTRLPVLAIGGVTIEQIEDIAAAGAAGIAAIGLFSPPRLTSVVAEIRRRFVVSPQSGPGLT
jgi:thiamine-phosphate diphosphorylase